MDDLEMQSLNDLIESLGLTFEATFVPASAAPRDDDWQCVTWDVTLTKGGRKIATRYHTGLAHIPGFPNGGRLSINQDANLKKTLETGKYPRDWQSTDPFAQTKPLPAPKLRDVLYVLIQDASALDFSRFEDWAWDFGYDTDSRKAKATYKVCLTIGLQLRQVLGEKAIEELREAFQDY